MVEEGGLISLSTEDEYTGMSSDKKTCTHPTLHGETSKLTLKGLKKTREALQKLYDYLLPYI